MAIGEIQLWTFRSSLFWVQDYSIKASHSVIGKSIDL